MAITIKSKIKFDLDGVPKNLRGEVMEELADSLELEILSTVGDGESPVEGESWQKKLSKRYQKIKGELSSSNIANMELTGEMLDDFKVKVKGNELEFGFFKGEAEELTLLKAENHNKWTSRAEKSPVPQRRFLPKGDQTLKSSIMKRLKSIIDDYRGEE